MGEDCWLSTLMVQSRWQCEYCAASEKETYCLKEFEEFYKHRLHPGQLHLPDQGVELGKDAAAGRLHQTLRGTQVQHTEPPQQTHEGKKVNGIQKSRPQVQSSLKGYVKIFIDNGYQNTNFLGMLTERSKASGNQEIGAPPEST
ncbi:uncharacterized protein LOC144623226 isoform X3 [Crassostrea virginica]